MGVLGARLAPNQVYGARTDASRCHAVTSAKSSIAGSACPSAHGREQAFAILREVADSGLTVMVVAYDPALTARADRRLHIVDGKIERCLGAADGRARFASRSERTLTANQSPAEFQLTGSAGWLRLTFNRM